MTERASALSSFLGFGVGVTGILFGWVQFYLRNRLERQFFVLKQQKNADAALIEKRFKIYSDYIVKLDSINADLTGSLSGAEFQVKMAKMFQAVQSGGNSQIAISGYMQRIAELTAIWGNARTKALEQLSTLRLVSSPPILALLDTYTDLTKQLIDSLNELLGKVVSDPASLLNAKLGDRAKEIHRKLNETISLIEAQMRTDIGVER